MAGVLRGSLLFIAAGVAAALFPALPAAAGGIEELRAGFARPKEIPFPKENPYTPEKAALGKALFFDPRLSGAQNMNCASCHNPSFGWEVPVKTAVGSLNEPLPRQAPTVLNAAWRPHFFWDGRAESAEAQAKGPIEAPGEMNLPLPVAVKRLTAIPAYRDWFAAAFPDTGITPDTIVAAIATFERTVVAGYAPFDAWVEGDQAALSESARRGFEVFTGKGRCADCHSGWEFIDDLFHDIGTTSTDRGRADIEQGSEYALFAFKTPSLRDTSQRAPYMHSGEWATLRDVVIHYRDGGIDRPSRSPLMGPVDLSDQDVDDLVAFMNSLTGAKQVVTLPVLPN